MASDGVIELWAVFTDGSRKGYSQTVGTTLDRDAGSAPSGAVGPGSLNLLTGKRSRTRMTRRTGSRAAPVRTTPSAGR